MDVNEKKKIGFALLKKRNTKEYVAKAKEQGFFVEAIIRIDLLIDTTLELLFALASSDEEKKTVENTKKALAITPEEVKEIQNKILLDKGVIDTIMLRRIKKFKHTRNTMAHDIFGSLNLLLETKGEDSLKSFEDNEKNLLIKECQKGEEILDELMEKIDKYLQKGDKK